MNNHDYHKGAENEDDCDTKRKVQSRQSMTTRGTGRTPERHMMIEEGDMDEGSEREKRRG